MLADLQGTIIGAYKKDIWKVWSIGRKEVEKDGTTWVVANFSMVETTMEEMNKECTAEADTEGEEGKEMEITRDEE